MVKISLSASKVLAGISLFCVNALAQSIDLDSSNIETYFDSKDKYFVLKEEYRKENLNINLREEQDNLYIDMGSNKLDIKAPVMITSMYDSSFSAREITLENILLQYSQANSINGNVNFKGEGDFTSMKQGNIIDLYENLEGSNPSLTINGNLNSEDLQISLYDTKGSIIVNGEANFNSNLEIEYENEELLKEDLILINATKGLNVDLSRVSLTNYGYYKEFYSIERLESSFSARIPTHYSLKLTNNQLILSPNFEFYLDSKNNKQILEDKITSLTNMKEILEDLLNWTSINEAEKIDIQKTLAKYNDQTEQISQITNSGLDRVSNDIFVQADESISTSNKDFISKILDGLENLKDAKSSMAIKLEQVGEKVANDIKSSAKSISNLNSASSGVNSSINVSNDVSISSRVAMLNNPYGNYASKLSNLRFAANDIYGQMIDDYKNSIWGNVIGGANIIDGESGALYGATIGMDRRINDDVILGAYFTYVDAEIKDNLLNQKSDNFQFGVYSNIRVAPKVEVNVKAFGQLSPSDQDIFNSGFNTINSADFTRKFFGLSTNVGYVFDFSDNTLFIKPFAGANYYYAHTPSYTESGIAGKDVKSAGNNSLSLELGAEFRKYMSEESYLFITPKIEQYVLNNGDDFVATLGGVELPSVKSDEKKKTYAQVVIGGNVDISEKFSLNAGIGAKQILAGKVDSKNETYVSGQVGFKYKF